jgi:asparagine synthase (glutamine-hydrolysing)
MWPSSPAGSSRWCCPGPAATSCSAGIPGDFEHYVDQYYGFWQRLMPNSTLAKVFAPIWDDVKEVWTRDIFRDVFLTHDNQLDRPEDYINHSLYFEARTFLHGLFVVEDKLSMAHGLETRVPFMDNDLVDFAMQCPVRLKLNNLAEVIRMNENTPAGKKVQYFQRTKDGKQLLRDVMRRYIPDDIADGEKQGFSAPDASWFKGDSIEFVRRTLMNGDARIYHWLDRDAIRGLVDEHLRGAENRRLLVWSLLNVEQAFHSVLT